MVVGEYIRTPKGIGKITNIYTGHNKQEDSGFCIDSCKDKFYCGRSAMKKLKSKPNIIDLIEVGDYVNGYLVTDVYKPDGNEVFRIEIERDTLKGHIIDKSSQIKSIITKEQFESMEYKVE